MNEFEKRRVTSIAEFKQRFVCGGFWDESVAYGLEMKPRPTDVIIAPFAKSGTTMLQQMVHTLRTGGDMSFAGISEVVPWIETAQKLGIDLDADQRWFPRAFKTHLPWNPIPKGGRYIVSIRRPEKTLVSHYRFLVGWLIEPGSVSLAEFAAFYCDRSEDGPREDWWTHLISWWPHRNDENVLMLSFESMVERRRETVARVAAFIGVDADDELIDLAMHRTSLAFMLEHQDQFSEIVLRTLYERERGMPSGGESAKVKAPLPKGAIEIPPEVIDLLDSRWKESVETEFGYSDYDTLRAALERADVYV